MIIHEVIRGLCKLRKIVIIMNIEEDISIAIVRMEKLLEGILVKIRESIKNDVQHSPSVKKIIDCIEIFSKFIVARMRKTPDAEYMHAINLKDCSTKTAETLLEIEELQNTSEEQNSIFDTVIKDIVSCINNEEELIANIKETSKVEIPKEIKDSVLQMLSVREQEKARQKLLQLEVDSAEQKLHNVMEFNTTAEKILFDNCDKVEQEYRDILAKYDYDIGACRTLMEKLFGEREFVNAENQDIEDQLVVQRVQYVQFRREREISLMRAFTEKIELFRRKQAAKTIQKAWRAYVERVSLRRRRKTRRK